MLKAGNLPRSAQWQNAWQYLVYTWFLWLTSARVRHIPIQSGRQVAGAAMTFGADDTVGEAVLTTNVNNVYRLYIPTTEDEQINAVSMVVITANAGDQVTMTLKKQAAGGVVTAIGSDTSAGAPTTDTLLISGLNSSYIPQSEIVTLNGVTPVVSVNTYIRVHRITLVTTGSGNTNAGTITARHTTTVANVFAVMPIGFSISQGTYFTIPLGYTGFVINYMAASYNTATVTLECAFKTRLLGGPIFLLRPFVVSNGQQTVVPVFGGLVFPEKTDIVMRMLSTSTSNSSVSGSYDLLLVKGL